MRCKNVVDILLSLHIVVPPYLGLLLEIIALRSSNDIYTAMYNLQVWQNLCGMKVMIVTAASKAEAQQAVRFGDVNWAGKMSVFAKQVQLGLALIY